jgi:hypothetical protein
MFRRRALWLWVTALAVLLASTNLDLDNRAVSHVLWANMSQTSAQMRLVAVRVEAVHFKWTPAKASASHARQGTVKIATPAVLSAVLVSSAAHSRTHVIHAQQVATSTLPNRHQRLLASDVMRADTVLLKVPMPVLRVLRVIQAST